MAAQLFAAEMLLPGHPDRLADGIADVLVQEATLRDPLARCFVQAAVHRQAVLVSGSLIGQRAHEIDVPGIVRQVYASAGYDKDWSPAPSTLEITIDLLRPGDRREANYPTRDQADDQALAIGYAVDRPSIDHLPPEQWLVQRLARRLARLLQESPELRLGPDGRMVVLLEEEVHPKRLVGFSATLAMARDAAVHAIEKTIHKVLGEELAVMGRLLPGFDSRVPEAFAVNAGLGLIPGGPESFPGVSGRHPGVDAYGPRVPASSGPLIGRDFYSPHRAGVIFARRLAKVLVCTGAAREVQTMVTFVPGQSEPSILALRGDGLVLDPSRWAGLLDRSLAGLGGRYSNTVSLLDVARFGHFGGGERPWEKLHFDDHTIDKVITER